jgi:hypothetical protein
LKKPYGFPGFFSNRKAVAEIDKTRYVDCVPKPPSEVV